MFNKLCIIGVGLIGGSVARAAREKKLCKEIVAFGREKNQENLNVAKKLGVIDRYYSDIRQAVENADCVMIATPVGAVESIFALLKDCWSENTIYTDVGSTKGNIVAAVNSILGFIPDNFVPTHPIAGAEQSGVRASVADLFVNKRLIITPVETTSAKAVNTIDGFWRQMGAVVSIMDVKHHDSVLAATSHLPHILAFALVDLLGRKDEQAEIFKYAAGGFKDFTRIASSNPTMWLDICLANKKEIVPLIRQLEDELETIAQMLENNKDRQLINTFTNARDARQRFLDQFK